MPLSCKPVTEEDLKDFAIIGGHYAEGGFNRFQPWTERMRRDFGESVKPHLEKIWQSVQEKYGANINIEKFGEAGSVMREVAQEIPFERSERARRGRVTIAEIFAGAQAEQEFVRKAVEGKIKPGTPASPEQVTALRLSAANEALEMKRNPERMKEVMNDPEKLKNFTSLLEAVQGTYAEAGRTLRTLREPVDPAVAEAMMSIEKLTENPRLKQAIKSSLGSLRKGEQPPPGFFDYVAEWGRFVKLASGSSGVRSLSSNSLMHMLRFPEQGLSAVFNNLLARKFGTERNRFFAETMADFTEGTWNRQNWKDAGKRFWGVMREQPESLANSILLARETGRVGGVIPGKFGRAVRTFQNLQGALDVFFRTVATRGAVARLATRRALQEGLKHSKEPESAFARRVDQLKRSIDQVLELDVRGRELAKQAGLTPGSGEYNAFLERYRSQNAGTIKEVREALNIIKEANEIAEEQTFQKQLTGVTKAVSDLRIRFPFLQIPIPFYATAVNLFKAAVERTPFTVLMPSTIKAITQVIRKPSPEFVRDAGPLSDKLSKAVLGTALFSFIAQQVLNVIDGSVTGRGPKDRLERERLMATGWRPDSIRVGDRWISYRGYEPFSTWMGLLANWREGQKDQKGWADNIAGATAAVVQNFVDNPFLKGVKDWMDAMSSERKAERLLSGMALGLVIPTMIRQTSLVIDPVLRDTRGEKDEGIISGAIRQFIAQTPFISEKLPARMDPFGDDIKIEKPGLRMAAVGISTRRNDPVWNEINRLDLNLGFPSDTYEGYQLSQVQHLALIKVSGQTFKRAIQLLMKSPGYRSLTDDERRKEIRYMQSQIRDQVKESLFGHMQSPGRVKNIFGRRSAFRKASPELFGQRIVRPGKRILQGLQQ
jgi:hypothetical protein